MYEVISEIPEKRLPELVSLFSTEWWTKDRPIDGLRVMLVNTTAVVGIVDTSTDKLVGFARAISDGIYKALIMDVIVCPEHRGRGISKILMSKMMVHPALKGVQDFEIYCKPSLVELYKKWGFQESPSGVLFMRATPVV
jgi:predicted GNAT family N-acyltransferase